MTETQIIPVTSSSKAEKSGPRSTRPNSDLFAQVLAGVQTVQLESATRLVTDATGLEKRQAAEAPSARHERITQETQQARQTEAQEKPQAADGPRPAEVARADAKDASQRTSAPADSRTRVELQQRPLELPTSSAERNGSGDQQQPAGRATATPAEKPAAGASARITQVNSSHPARQAPPPVPGQQPAAQQVTAGGPNPSARVEGAAAQSSTSSGSAAASVGRLLAEGGGGQSTRAIADAQQAVQQQPATQATREPANRAAGEPHRRDEAAKPQTQAGDSRRAEFEQLVRNIRLNIGPRMSSATIRLNPPELGTMRIDVRMEDGVLRVRVEAASPEARDLLASRAAELTTALKEHNIDVGRFEIVSNNQDSDGQSGGLNVGVGNGRGNAADRGWESSDESDMAAGLPAGPEEATTASAADEQVMTDVARDARLDIRI